MGVWGYGLYSNDITCDVRDTYLNSFYQKKDNYQALVCTMNLLEKYLGTDDEPLLWYALAETQWQYGHLIPEVKEKALYWIEIKGGALYWEDTCYSKRFISTLNALKKKLMSPMPPSKKILTRVDVITNPWNIGDFYAFQFNSEKAKEIGVLGKYIVMQKIADERWFENSIFTRIQIFHKVFDEIPTVDKLLNIKILPIDDPKRFMPQSRFGTWPLNLTAVMIVNQKRDYNHKNFTYIGNAPDQYHVPKLNKTDAEREWKHMEEEWLCDLYEWWEGFEYEQNNDEFIVRKKS